MWPSPLGCSCFVSVSLAHPPNSFRFHDSNNAHERKYFVALSTGHIPEEVASMPTLELFDCSNNQLSGKGAWHGRPAVA